MAKLKNIVSPTDMEISTGTRIHPDNFLMHCICRVWRSDYVTADKFSATRIFIEAIVQIRLEQERAK